MTTKPNTHLHTCPKAEQQQSRVQWVEVGVGAREMGWLVVEVGMLKGVEEEACRERLGLKR